MSRSRVFSNVNLNKSQDYYDYENFTITWNSPEKYEVIRHLGRGKYSEVFHGIDVTQGVDRVIKVLKPVKKRKVNREVKILQNLRGGINIIQLVDCVYEMETKTQALIFEYVDNAKFALHFSLFEDRDIRYYIFQLLKALHFAHSRGIMHRDVKPHNIAIDHSKKKLRLIDWGLAEFYHPCQEYNVRVASRHYKAPELLVDFQCYDYSLDLWGVGCVLAMMVFKKNPFFYGTDNFDQLLKIVKVLGTEDLYAYLNTYKLQLPSKLSNVVRRFLSFFFSEFNSIYVYFNSCKKVSWKSFVNNDNKKYSNPQVFDLLDRLLQYDHAKRLTAAEAMDHEYFSILSEEEKAAVN
ncbi:uncharacterized protein LOC135122332 [Zophobas morio]|uniref:uncharacterized protein LOC135122332 n=1 Tax=Zophobas morio TaxID=2755281 RepID=UPI0030826FAA